MPNSPSSAAHKVGPFAAGSTLSDLVDLAQQENLGLRLVDSKRTGARPYSTSDTRT